MEETDLWFVGRKQTHTNNCDRLVEKLDIWHYSWYGFAWDSRAENTLSSRETECLPCTQNWSQETPGNTGLFYRLRTVWHCLDKPTIKEQTRRHETFVRNWSSVVSRITSIACPNSRSNVTTQMHWIQSEGVPLLSFLWLPSTQLAMSTYS